MEEPGGVAVSIGRPELPDRENRCGSRGSFLYDVKLARTCWRWTIGSGRRLCSVDGGPRLVASVSQAKDLLSSIDYCMKSRGRKEGATKAGPGFNFVQEGRRREAKAWSV